jgi:hypothetical protein
MALEIVKFPSKDSRNEAFQVLRHSEKSNEREVVKWSSTEPIGKQDSKGRDIWETTWFLAYPKAPEQTVVQEA